jgi:hypothetical protein
MQLIPPNFFQMDGDLNSLFILQGMISDIFTCTGAQPAISTPCITSSSSSSSRHRGPYWAFAIFERNIIQAVHVFQCDLNIHAPVPFQIWDQSVKT